MSSPSSAASSRPEKEKRQECVITLSQERHHCSWLTQGHHPRPAPHLCHVQGPPTQPRPVHTPCSHALFTRPAHTPSSHPVLSLQMFQGQPVPAGDSPRRTRETRSKSPSTSSIVSSPPHVTDRASGLLHRNQPDAVTVAPFVPGAQTLVPEQ